MTSSRSALGRRHARARPPRDGRADGRALAPPTELVATFKNSGATTVRNVLLVVTFAGHRLTRTTVSLRKAVSRHVTFALPAGLPPRFTLSVRTEPVPGERNLSNNQVAWRIRVRR